MRQRESERHRAAETVTDQNRVLGDAELLEAIFDSRDVGVHQRQHFRFRAVEARQVDQRDAMLGGKRRQHRIESMPVGQKRLQHHDVGACSGSHGGERAVTGGQLFKFHHALQNKRLRQHAQP